MSFLSKVELKRQLQALGINVKGNYVRKRDLKKVIATNDEFAKKYKIESKTNIDLIPIEIVFSAGSLETTKDKIAKIEELDDVKYVDNETGEFLVAVKIPDYHPNVDTFIATKLNQIEDILKG